MTRADGTPEGLEDVARRGVELLRKKDAVLYELLDQESRRQSDVLMMVAASSIADPSVLACMGTAALNVTTEGYPGARFHAGCQVVDKIETLAIERAKAAFGARYANVQRSELALGPRRRHRSGAGGGGAVGLRMARAPGGEP